MKRRYKLLIIILIAIITIYFSYYFFKQDKFIYLSIKDSFINDKVIKSKIYTYEDLLLNDYKKNNNNEFKSYTTNYMNHLYYLLKNGSNDLSYYVKNANVITISVGTYELMNYKELNEEIIINYLNDLYKTLQEIRRLNSKEIYLLSVLNNDSTQIAYINKKIEKYSKELNLKFIDIKNINHPNYLIIDNQIFITQTGHINIYNYIKKS